MNKVSSKFFPRQQPGEKNRQEKSLGSEFELSRNSNSVTNSVVPEHKSKLFEETVQKKKLEI